VGAARGQTRELSVGALRRLAIRHQLLGTQTQGDSLNGHRTMSQVSSEPQTDDEADAFRRHGHVVLPALIDASLAQFFWSYVHTKFGSLLLTGRDRMVPNTLAEYGDVAFEGLLEHVRPRVEARSGLTLLPTYSYFRLYKHGDVLRRHRDRPACEISVSLNLGHVSAEPWPLFVDGPHGPFAARLDAGDALLYRGIDLPHWRDPFPGKLALQVFLHYVDGTGPHAGRKFDGRQSLMRPKLPDVPQGQEPTDRRDS
jgi:hypothetical protein